MYIVFLLIGVVVTWMAIGSVRAAAIHCPRLHQIYLPLMSFLVLFCMGKCLADLLYWLVA